jgi:molybdopterin-guanine dinucleotide biosynthesis protein MobB
MKKISVIGFSGSGKTHTIINAIKKLKEELDLDSIVIKYIHEHQINKEGKDTYKYLQSGAQFSITKNVYNETTIFLSKELSIGDLIDWIEKAPFKSDIIFFEGFRDLDVPTLLCLKKETNLKDQLNKDVRAISGMIATSYNKRELLGYPMLNIERDFDRFIDLFKIN